MHIKRAHFLEGGGGALASPPSCIKAIRGTCVPRLPLTPLDVLLPACASHAPGALLPSKQAVSLPFVL